MELVMRAEELMLRVSRVDRVPSEVVKSNKTGHQKMRPLSYAMELFSRLVGAMGRMLVFPTIDFDRPAADS